MVKKKSHFVEVNLSKIQKLTFLSTFPHVFELGEMKNQDKMSLRDKTVWASLRPSRTSSNLKKVFYTRNLYFHICFEKRTL